MPKTLALYLPQYYQTDYNDKWWGTGYTEWVACKKAKSLFKGHYQPRIPLNGRYYNLTNADDIRWQAETAKSYGIDGFCIYHYYSEGRLLLEKPAELLRENEDIDIEYCFSWANHDWMQNWFGRSKRVLLKQEYGDEQSWQKHFEYVNRYFQDKRYIKIDNKPVFIIYDSYSFNDLNKFMKLWNRLAVEAGFKGVYFVKTLALKEDKRELDFDAVFEYEPGYTRVYNQSPMQHSLRRTKTILRRYYNKAAGRLNMEVVENVHDYNNMCEKMIRGKQVDAKKVFYGAFTDWDNTPRRGYDGIVFKGSTPQRFRDSLVKQLERSIREKSELLIITAWNEWGEGAYLEPDEKFGYAYLEAVKSAISSTKDISG